VVFAVFHNIILTNINSISYYDDVGTASIIMSRFHGKNMHHNFDISIFVFNIKCLGFLKFEYR